MKKIIFMLALFTLTLCSCSDNNGVKEGHISTTEYDFSGSLCGWNIEDICPNYILRVINSEDELLQFFLCAKLIETPHKDIDFEKYSLICAFGLTCENILNTNNTLYRKNNGEYIFTVTEEHSTSKAANDWSIAVLAPKIKKGTSVKMEVKTPKGTFQVPR